MNRILPVLILFFIFLNPFSAFSLESDEQALANLIEASYKTDIPVWLLMERGKQAYEIGQYGLASRVFREVLNREKIYPDAEVWLAYIYEQEGELILAEKQYKKALEFKNNLYILEDEITVLYHLSDIYRKTGQYGQYESVLLEIVSKDQDENILNLQYSMLDAVKNQDIDKMFELYRYDENRYNKARKELGIFYYQTGRYTEAQTNLIIPLVSAATTGFNYIYDKTADYDYYNFDTHNSRMMKYDKLSEYLHNDQYFQTAYFLAAALYADGYSDAAEYLWLITSKYDDKNSSWHKRSLRQLNEPYIEPIITHRS